MTAIIERLFRLKLASSMNIEDAFARDHRIAELRALLADIAEPTGERAVFNDSIDRAEPWEVFAES